MAQLHSWNSPETALDDAALASKDQLELATVQAENCLIAGDFSAAAEQAEDLLKKGLYVTGSEVLQIHASYVLLQASYELDRYSWPADAHKFTCEPLQSTHWSLSDWTGPNSFFCNTVATSPALSHRSCFCGEYTG